MNKIVKIADLEAQIARTQAVMDERNERIAKGETDEDDCFISIKVNSDAIKEANMQIAIIKQGGTAWFDWYMDMDGNPCTDARWVET